ncbi:MAG: hypothetical protein V1753_07940 [Pseudomonadota bacterium]
MIDLSTYVFFVGLLVALIAGLLGIDNFKEYIASKLQALTKRRIGFISLVLLIVGLTTTTLGYFIETPRLSVYRIETKEEKGVIKATIFTTSSANEHLGRLYFKVQLQEKSEDKILDFWPASSAFIASPESKTIAPDGKSATLSFAVIGPIAPVVEVTLSGNTSFTLTGNYGLRKYIVLAK